MLCVTRFQGSEMLFEFLRREVLDLHAGLKFEKQSLLFAVPCQLAEAVLLCSRVLFLHRAGSGISAIDNSQNGTQLTGVSRML